MSNHNACALIMNKRIKPIAVGLDIPALSCAQKRLRHVSGVLQAVPALIAEGASCWWGQGKSPFFGPCHGFARLRHGRANGNNASVIIEAEAIA